MVKVEVPFNYLMDKTIDAMRSPGLLLTSVSLDGRANVMAIGWGLLGMVWRKPIFLVLVRPSRFTHRLISETGEFVVNVPKKDMGDIVSYCGSVSGSKNDKIREKGIRTVPGIKVKVPSIADCPIHYECKVVYKMQIDPAVISKDLLEIYKDGDYHTLFFGEVLATFAEEQG